jgi:Mg2+-importing ATPase
MCPKTMALRGDREEHDSASCQALLGELFESLHSSEAGLSSDDASSRLRHYGANELRPSARRAPLAQLAKMLASPLVVILLLASLASALLGELINAGIVAAMVFLSTTLNFLQTNRSQTAAQRLRQQVAPTATALRDGQWTLIRRRLLVPGDVVRLRAGDMVPGDARLIRSKDLHVNEAALTGESLPTEKEGGDAVPGDKGTVFLGTSIVSGTGTALVLATGSSTRFGDIAARLAMRAPETEFERGARGFGMLIMKTVVFLVLFVFLVTAALRHDPFESLLFAVALAVGLTPEFLPMITTITLGQGAVHMGREKVIVKHLESIQNLGSMDVLCSDKTGTLTSGETALVGHVDVNGESSEHVFELSYINSFFETGVENSFNAAILDTAKTVESPNPLDAAILKHDHPLVTGFAKIDEIPFDFERRRLSIVVEQKGRRLLITKGAPEGVLGACSSYESGERIVPIDESGMALCTDSFKRLSSEGYRVLAVAYRELEPKGSYGVTDESGLIMAGYLTFSDPPVPDAREVLDALRKDGVAVKILTGDNELVTRYVCSQVGLDPGRIVLGDELWRMTDAALAQVAETSLVFARVTPAQKNRILIALKTRGHVVGFLGDGINDAPSLHTADVGISVAGAVDVAKDAAEIILMERSLRVLHSGIGEGRRALGNVMKYLLMGTSSNFGNMFSMAAASLFLPFLPMLPTQILLNNFLYDLAQVTIPSDNVDEEFIRQPRRWDIGVIKRFMVYVGPISSLFDFLTFLILLGVFHASESLFHTGWFVESLATQTLVLFVIRTGGNPLKSRPSRPLAITSVAVVGTGLLLPYTPIASVLGFSPLPGAYFSFLLLMTATYLILVEVVKRRLMRQSPAAIP